MSKESEARSSANAQPIDSPGFRPPWRWLLPLAILTLVLAIWAVIGRLAPPSRLTIAAGPQSGAYQAFAENFRDRLRKQGIDLRILHTSGAAENLTLLETPGSGVDAAFVKGGLADGRRRERLRSLGRFFYEPVWIFHRLPSFEYRLASFTGKRIAIGEPGGGTRVIARRLLAANGIHERNSQLLELDFAHSVQAIHKGDVDAAIMVGSVSDTAIHSLLVSPDIRPLALANGPAYVRMFPFLAHLEIPRGAIDLASEMPGETISLLATTGAVVVRADLHPALAHLLTEVATAVHGGSGLLEKVGEFPKQSDPEYEMADAAVRFYRHGTPYLYRHLSFWFAELLERLLLIALPAIAVAYPLTKGIKYLYQYAVRWRIRQWYQGLRMLEARMSRSVAPAELDLCAAQLDALAEDIRTAPVPFEFRADVEIVETLLRATQSGLRARLSVAKAPLARPAPMSADDRGSSA